MGLIVDGKWVDQWYDTKASQGRFVRQDSAFRNWIKADGKTPYKAEAGRYHLYVSLACPWAHRTLIFRKLKGLEDIISTSTVKALMLDKGWEMDQDPDHNYLYEIYLRADSSYEGRVTVPVLWDKHTESIVSNESSEIIRMLNTEFDSLTGNDLDFYPEGLRAEIDEINGFVYSTINNGVYKTGFATEQAVYEEAFSQLFDALDQVEQRLTRQRYLVGDQVTEADWRLFTTLIRFDPVYVGHFKCNKRRIADYRQLSRYLRELYNWPGVAQTVSFEHIKEHYYGSHKTINPTGIVPVGPELDLRPL